MAEDVIDAGETEELTPPRGGSKTGLILILNMVLVAGVLVYLFFFNKPPAANQPAASEVVESTSEPGPLVAFDNFIVNLADIESTRYLKVGISFELSKPEDTDALRKREPLIRDAVIQLTSAMTFKQVRTQQGKETLRTDLLARLESLLGSKMVKNMYYTEFVVQ